LANRNRLGLDRHDEVWQGEYHLAPAPSFEHSTTGVALVALLRPLANARRMCVSLEFNLGSRDDYRVPDLGVHVGEPSGVWLATAAIVVEVLSPGDDSLAKMPFYFDHGVDEVLTVDLADLTVQWFERGAQSFLTVTSSTLLGTDTATVASALGWA
jgi:Uma2 family endonuclease